MVLIYIWCFIPHIFLWGSCFWFCIPSASSSCSARALSHTHNFVTHTRLVAGDATALWVAGVALGDIHLPLRGRGGTWRHQPSFLRGRRGTWRHRRCVCVAGRHLWHSLTHTTLSRTTLSFVWRGRRGTCSNAFTHTQLFHSHKLQHTALSHANLSRTHLFHAQTWTHTHTHFHTQLFHTQPFTHNSFTHSGSHKTLLHTTPSHIAFHARLFHTQHCHTHTQPFLVTHTHHSFTHSSITYSSFTQPVFRHLISFPIQFSHLFWACWKKLACGVIRSFNYNGQNPLVIQRSELETHHI